MNILTPYANLDPHLILDAIESQGFACSGSLLALNSYENRVFQVGIHDDSPVIAKFYRPERWSDAAILEEHQFAFELTAQEIPLVAPWRNHHGESLHHFGGYRFAIFPRFGGRALELDQLEHLAWMGRFIGRVHAVGACKTFAHRPRLDSHTHGYASYRYLVDHAFIPEPLRDIYAQTVETILKKIEHQFELADPVRMIRLHGDIHAGNVLWNDHGPHIVDLDDCVMGPAMQDIWMLLSGDQSQRAIQLEVVLSHYEKFHEFDYRELHLIEALRTLRMLQYSAWLACRWEDPAFPKSFPWFNTPHYWQEQVQQLQEQLELLTMSENG